MKSGNEFNCQAMRWHKGGQSSANQRARRALWWPPHRSQALDLHCADLRRDTLQSGHLSSNSSRCNGVEGSPSAA